jgi:hypothetical protein
MRLVLAPEVAVVEENTAVAEEDKVVAEDTEGLILTAMRGLLAFTCKGYQHIGRPNKRSYRFQHDQYPGEG